MTDGQPEVVPDDARTLLVHLGTAMVATGQPINEVEDELAEVALALGHPDAQIAAGPTGVILSLASGEPSTYEAVTGALRLDQAAQVREIRRDLVQGRVDPSTAVDRLLALRHQPPRYPVALANLGWVATATGIALILQPGWRNVALAALAALVVVALFRLAQRFPLLSTLLPVVAAFLVILGRNNWMDVTLNLWGPFQADIKIPLLVLIVFLLGFLPTFLVLRGRIWALKRRLLAAQRPPETVANPPAVPPEVSRVA